jgi:hypothetical protein
LADTRLKIDILRTLAPREKDLDAGDGSQSPARYYSDDTQYRPATLAEHYYPAGVLRSGQVVRFRHDQARRHR